MTRPSMMIGITLAALLGACSSGPGEENPTRLWLALAGSETQVQLLPEEPEPY